MPKFNIVTLHNIHNCYLLFSPTVIKAIQEKSDKSLPTIAIIPGNTNTAELFDAANLFDGSRMHVLHRCVGNANYVLNSSEGGLNSALVAAFKLTDEKNRYGYLFDARKDLELHWLKIKYPFGDTKESKLQWQAIISPKNPQDHNPYMAILRQEWIEFFGTEKGKADCCKMVAPIKCFFMQNAFNHCNDHVETIKKTLEDDSLSSMMKLLIIKKAADDICRHYFAKNIKEDSLLLFCSEIRTIFTEIDRFTDNEPKYLYFEKHIQALSSQLLANQLIPRNFATLNHALNERVQALIDHANVLDDKNPHKANEIRKHGGALKTMLDEFFEQDQDTIARDFESFEKRFSQLLISKNDEMKKISVNYATIVSNIAVAMTGIGLFLILAQLIKTKTQENRFRFLFTDKKTTTEKYIDGIADCFQQHARKKSSTSVITAGISALRQRNVLKVESFSDDDDVAPLTENLITEQDERDIKHAVDNNNLVFLDGLQDRHKKVFAFKCIEESVSARFDKISSILSDLSEDYKDDYHAKIEIGRMAQSFGLVRRQIISNRLFDHSLNGCSEKVIAVIKVSNSIKKENDVAQIEKVKTLFNEAGDLYNHEVFKQHHRAQHLSFEANVLKQDEEFEQKMRENVLESTNRNQM